LILDAAAAGFVDLREYRFEDCYWQAKLVNRLAAYKRRQDLQYRIRVHEQHIAAFAAPDVNYDHHWKRAKEELEIIKGLLQPWDKAVLEQSRKTDMEKWSSIYGDINSPETQEKIRKTREHLRKRRADKGQS
jgi:hypothetical protein